MAETAINETEGFVVLGSVLLFFFVTAVVAVAALGGSFGEGMKSFIQPAGETYLAARNSAGACTIATSLFAGGMGAWIVYGTTELGANPAISWWGVIGYSFGSALPAVVIAYLAPHVREVTGDKAFSTADFGLQRYGRFMQLFATGVSCFYMFIYLVAELTSVGNIYRVLVKPDATNEWTNWIIVPVGVVTLLYTGVAGLPASIITDKFQGFLVLMLVALIGIAALSIEENHVSNDEWKKASNSTTAGFRTGVSLIIAILGAELFNQASWQRVYAAKDDKALFRGFMGGALLIMPVMMLFGVFGMLAYAKDPAGYDSFSKLAYLSFFDLLKPMAKGWKVLVLILITCLCCSSVDSLQNALASVFSRDITQQKLSVNWSRLAVVAFNIPAVIMASGHNHSAVELFLVADIVCCAVAPALFMGLIKETGWKKCGPISIPMLAPTELGAFLGGLGGLGTIMVLGSPSFYDSGDAVNPFTGKKYAAYPFSSFWLVTGDSDQVCALCGEQVLVYFILAPVFGFLLTVFFSGIDLMIRGERAKQPIVPRDLWGMLPEIKEPEVPRKDSVVSLVEVAPEPEAPQDVPETKEAVSPEAPEVGQAVPVPAPVNVPVVNVEEKRVPEEAPAATSP
eukprot:Hpha_TRINITY_DN15988_c2_g9::TRINITY_DN15988_c2_g9_i1::g.70409::m.70409